MNIADYFNPFSGKFPDLEKKFEALSTWSKAAAIGLSILAGLGTFFVLGIGGIAAFRFTVKIFSGENITPEAARVEELREDLFPPVRTEEKSQSLPTEALKKVEGNKSQYDPSFDGRGTSACTCICLEAAARLLPLKSLRQINPQMIDTILKKGVNAYQRFSSVDHTSVDNYDLSNFELRRLVFRDGVSLKDDPYSGMVSSLGDMLKKAERDLPKLAALVLTKTPESVLIMIKPSGEFWLFDSHSRNGSHAYVEKFENAGKLTERLDEMFPFFDTGDHGQNFILNSFNAYAVSSE